MSTAKKELHLLLDDKEIHGIPLLIVGNKIDVAGHMTEKEIIEGKISKIEKILHILFFVMYGDTNEC